MLGRRYSLPALLLAVTLAFRWGLSTILFNVFPYGILKQGQVGAVAVRDAVAGKLPWYDLPTSLVEKVVVVDPDRLAPGLTLITRVGQGRTHRISVVDPRSVSTTLRQFPLAFSEPSPASEPTASRSPG